MSEPLPPGGIAKALIGVSRLAQGKADGLVRFVASRQALLASLTPWLAFGLVGAALQTIRGDAGGAVIGMLLTVVALLTPVVVSHGLAQRWQRADRWLLYAVALNWCYWVTPFAAAAMVVVVWVLLAVGVPPSAAGLLPLFGLAGYLLWLNWFLARWALGLSVSRAAILVLVVNIVTAAVILGPGYLMLLVRPAAA